MNADSIELLSVQAYREFFAEVLVRSAGSDDARLIAAFSVVESERFFDKGPWKVFAGSGYINTISDDPRHLYQDILVALDADRGINNGQPSLHARCMAACDLDVGEAVLHIGAGSGYYTAILSHVVGVGGCVTAYEIDPSLAERAHGALAAYSNVRVVQGSGCEGHLPMADLIYVSAGATHPLLAWLEALKPNGRLVFPLTVRNNVGTMLRIQRCAAGYRATGLFPVAFIPCIGGRDDSNCDSLARALERNSTAGIRSLHVGTPADGTAWCVGQGWWLSTVDVD